MIKINKKINLLAMKKIVMIFQVFRLQYLDNYSYLFN